MINISAAEDLFIQVKRLILPVRVVILFLYCSVVFALDSKESTTGTIQTATCPYNTVSAVVMLLRSRTLIVVASVILIISLTYLFYLMVLPLITKSRYSKQRFIEKIIELKGTNDKLRREIARLNREQVEYLEEYLVDAEESPQKEIPELDPQKLKNLVDLANRLR